MQDNANIDKCIHVKFSWGTQKLKRFTEQKTVPQTFYNRGRHVRSRLCVSHCRRMQTSREQ